MIAQSIQEQFANLSLNAESPIVDNQSLLTIIQTITRNAQRRERELIQENDKLKREQSILLEKNNRLEASHEDLVGQVQDLRSLVKRVYEEGEIQLQKQMQKNQLQEQRVRNLTNALHNLQENISSFSQSQAALSLWDDYEGEVKEEQKSIQTHNKLLLDH